MLDYQKADVVSATDHLSKEMYRNWVRIREITTQNMARGALSTNYLQNETDELLR